MVTPLRRRDIFRHKKVLRQFLPGVDPVLLEIRHAVFRQEIIVDQKLAGKFARRLGEHRIGRVGHDLRLARLPHDRIAAEQILHRRGRDHGARPQRVDGDSFLPQLAGKPEHHHAHAELRHGVGGVRREPFLFHVERRRNHQDVRVWRFLPDAPIAHFDTTKVPRVLI